MLTYPKRVFRHCLRCGSDAVLYRQDDAIECEQCKFCYYINAAAAVAILLVDEEGQLLLTKRAYEPGKGLLDLPGGFVDIGERAEDAVERELQEELNIRVENMHYLGSYPNEYVYSGLSIFTLDMAFVCGGVDFSDIKAKDDVAAFDFYALEAIDFEDIAFDSIRKIIKDFKDNCEYKYS